MCVCSLFNVEGKIGGNAGLSDLGKVYAQALPDVMMLRLPMVSVCVCVCVCVRV